MKKLTALLLCFLLLCSVTVFAIEDYSTDVTISTTVKADHKITVTAENAKVFFEGVEGTEFTVERLSEPRLLIRADRGNVIKSVTVNGTDVTDDITGGYLTLSAVYEDKALVVTTEREDTTYDETYTVKGTVTLNGEPMPDVTLELCSKKVVTDENGYFVFEDVTLGEHSITALVDGKVMGYLAFELKEDSFCDITLREDGTYTVSVDKRGIGVELDLELNDGLGALVPTGATMVSRCLWWLWLLLLLIIILIVIIVIYRKKKAKKKNDR